jgi:hypothetical protein
MSGEPAEVFVIYDAGRESASVVFDWGGPAAETGVVARTREGVDAEFSLTPPVRLLALTVTRPFFGRDTAFVRHLYELLGNSVLAKLLRADASGITIAAAVPVPPAEVEQLLACWERLAPARPGMSAGERASAAEWTAAGVLDLARQRLREWFVPVLLHPVVARHGAPPLPGGEGAGAHPGEPVAFHGRVTLREDLARIGGVDPVARADVMDGRLLLRARATGAAPSATLVISSLGSESAELTATPGGGEFRAELALPPLPGSASLVDDYECVLSVGLRGERTPADE